MTIEELETVDFYFEVPPLAANVLGKYIRALEGFAEANKVNMQLLQDPYNEQLK